MQREPIETTRLLALHVRPQRFGFAVFKGPKQLLDWGGGTYPPRSGRIAAQVSKRLDPLLRIYGPSVVIARKLSAREQRQYDLRPIVSVVKGHAAKHSAEFVPIGRKEVHQVFLRSDRKVTKYQIAAQVAICFPELLWKLPPPRKPWQKEHYNMAIFDAVALGISYFSRFGNLELHIENAPKASEPAS